MKLFIAIAITLLGLSGETRLKGTDDRGAVVEHSTGSFSAWPSFIVSASAALSLPSRPRNIDDESSDRHNVERRQLPARALKKTTTKRKRTTSKKPSPKSTTTVVKSNTTSYNLIQLALNSGAINKATAALYNLYAQFGDPALPAKFRVAATTVPNGGADTPHALVNIFSVYKSLTPAQQNQVKPYFVAPYHGGSWWQKKFAPGSPNGSKPRKRDLHKRAAPVDIFTDPTLLLRDWDAIDSSDGNVRVWYQIRYASTDKKLATDMANEAVKVWAKHKSLMTATPIRDGGKTIDGRGGDDRLDISLVDSGSNTMPYGRTCTSQSPAYIMFNRGVGTSWKEELAHEMFHAFQYAFKVKTDCMAIEYAWLSESTAQWSEDWVYPSNADQHRAARFWMDNPDTSLDDDSKIGSGRRYGGYLVWHYANLVLGQPTIVRQVWNKAATLEQLPALDAAFQGGMKKHWPQIALHNFNGGSVDELKKRGLARQVNVIGGGQDPMDFGLGGDNTIAVPMPVDLPYLSASYLYLDLTKDANLRSFIFYNGLRAKLDKKTVTKNEFNANFDTHVFELKGDTTKTKGAAIWAMWKLNGKQTWEKPEDWSDSGYMRFCRQKKNEKIDELIIVFSNSEWKDKTYRVKKYGSLDSILFGSDVFCNAAKGPTRLDSTWKEGHWIADGSATAIKTQASKQKPGPESSLSTFSAIYLDGGSTVPSDCNITLPVGIPGVPPIKDPVKCLPHYIAPTKFFPDGSGTVTVTGSGTDNCDTDPPTTATSTAAGSFSAADNGVSYLKIMDTSVSGPAHRAYLGMMLDEVTGSVTLTSGCTGQQDPAPGGVYLLTEKVDGSPRPVDSKDQLTGTLNGLDGTVVQWTFDSAPEA